MWFCTEIQITRGIFVKKLRFLFAKDVQTLLQKFTGCRRAMKHQWKPFHLNHGTFQEIFADHGSQSLPMPSMVAMQDTRSSVQNPQPSAVMNLLAASSDDGLKKPKAFALKKKWGKMVALWAMNSKKMFAASNLDAKLPIFLQIWPLNLLFPPWRFRSVFFSSKLKKRVLCSSGDFLLQEVGRVGFSS